PERHGGPRRAGGPPRGRRARLERVLEPPPGLLHRVQRRLQHGRRGPGGAPERARERFRGSLDAANHPLDPKLRAESVAETENICNMLGKRVESPFRSGSKPDGPPVLRLLHTNFGTFEGG